MEWDEKPGIRNEGARLCFRNAGNRVKRNGSEEQGVKS